MSGFIACCDCGTKIPPNDAARCTKCLNVFVRDEVREGLRLTNVEITQCSECGRWEDIKKHWHDYEWESAGLLALCLKKLRLDKVHVVDAQWIWTEPHSRRLKIALTIEKAVMDSKVQVQTKLVAEMIHKTRQCEHCVKSESDHSWGACIQIRQRVGHRRTFFKLEESLNKAGLTDLIYNVRLDVKDGLDLYFRSKNQANRILEHITQSLPVRVTHSKKVVGRDHKSNIDRIEYTSFVEVGTQYIYLMSYDIISFVSHIILYFFFISNTIIFLYFYYNYR
jgi:nonsense-mediated mRNA decay protein 3